jgi:hypothetical protein
MKMSTQDQLLAYEFVQMAGCADNSGGKYMPECQECGFLDGGHTPKCRLKAWLERNAPKGGAA